MTSSTITLRPAQPRPGPCEVSSIAAPLPPLKAVVSNPAAITLNPPTDHSGALEANGTGVPVLKP